jgi:ribosomal protein S18 acetylase RimI-like enzyme
MAGSRLRSRSERQHGQPPRDRESWRKATLGRRATDTACGICDARAPGPRGLSVVRWHVFSIATDSPHRRRGHARACPTALLAWFRHDTGAETVELSATSEGVALYTSLGFRERAHPTMGLGLSAPTQTFL